jgi:hypothetical protein
MQRPRTCQGIVRIAKHVGYGQRSFEIMTVHFPDGGASCTIADLTARLGIDLKEGDRIRIAISKLAKIAPRKRKPNKNLRSRDVP